MREGWPSITASCVAFARAAASCRPLTDPPLHDPIARALFPWPVGKVGQTVSRAFSFGLVDHIALRSAVIDDALAFGFPQVVLLGAGLDARAYRLPLEDVFELDHPASQALKLRSIEGLTPRARSVRHVAADFTKDDVAGALAGAGHDAARPTAWVLEGLTPYLERPVTESLLDVVSRRSAPGSLVAMTYFRRTLGFAHWIGGAALHQIGEPLGASFSRDDVARMMRERNLSPRSDTSSADWAKRFGASAMMALGFRVERLVIASSS